MRRGPIVVAVPAFAAALASACASKPVAGPTRPGDEMVVLLADAPGIVGRARVATRTGAADLDAAREGTLVAPNEAPGRVETLSQRDVNRIFGAALSALPPAPRRFTLHFHFESDELTDRARRMLPDVLRAVKGRAAPDVVVVGHTDTSGDPEANFALALKRAMTVRDLLVQAGLDPAAIEVTSHGEQDLLVKTADDIPEPRNRRVDVAVR